MAELVYSIDEQPDHWWETLLYGWQHTLVDISPFVLPLAVATAIGLDDGARAALINYSLIAMGLATLIQTTVGNRLPIVQGPSATLTGTLAPVGAQLGPAAMWGAAFVSAAVEALVGSTGTLGALRRFCPPVVSGVVVLTIGLSLGQLAVRLSVGNGSLANLGFAVATIALVVVLQVAGRQVAGGLLSRVAIFVAIWVVGLGGGSLLGRVDWSLVATMPWFQVPRVFPFGGPGFGWEFGAAAIVAVLAGYLGSMVESIGDYVATCSVVEEPLTKRHVNRGIAAEGVGCLLALSVGGLPCTSYTQNIGIIKATGVGSRAVVRLAAVVLLLYGLCPKFGALLVALPRPVLGGVFVIVCGLIATTGIAMLASAHEDDGAALLAGITLVVALGLPAYVHSVLGPVWLDSLPQLAQLLVTNSVVLSVLLAVGLNAALRGLPSAPDVARRAD